MHGGDLDVESREGEGTTFVVRVPTGRRHLDPEHIKAPSSAASAPLNPAPFLEEARRWVAGGPPGAALTEDPPDTPPSAPDVRVLIVDDNADMRDYLRRLLAPHWVVRTASDGRAALAAIAEQTVDLVLTDLMMPDIDGAALVQRIRANPETRAIPVIALSARAGEDSRVEGLEAGVDDYLVKPFAARELVARVRTQIELARLRREARPARRGRQAAEPRPARRKTNSWRCSARACNPSCLSDGAPLMTLRGDVGAEKERGHRASGPAMRAWWTIPRCLADHAGHDRPAYGAREMAARCAGDRDGGPLIEQHRHDLTVQIRSMDSRSTATRHVSADRPPPPHQCGRTGASWIATAERHGGQIAADCRQRHQSRRTCCQARSVHPERQAVGRPQARPVWAHHSRLVELHRIRDGVGGGDRHGKRVRRAPLPRSTVIAVRLLSSARRSDRRTARRAGR